MTESPALSDLVDEGMLLVGAAVRLAVKNTLIVGILRDGESWDEPALLESMRRDIRGLVTERLAELTRIESAIDRARGKPGQPRSPEDYRRLDVPILERRREVSEALTGRLRSLLREDDLLRVELFRARESALAEMQQHSWSASGLLRPESPPDDRARALRRLRRDLAALRPARIALPRRRGGGAESDTDAAAEYWENRYREKGRSWSGDVNAALAREVGGIRPGTALDLGSGEGGDALWLAREGWSVTAVDIAPTALAIGAAAQHPDDDITWIAADLATWQPPSTYDLVTSCFLHSTVELPREAILRRAAAAVAPGGILLIVGHSGAPHWAASEGGEGAGDAGGAGHAVHAGHVGHAGAHEEPVSPDPEAMPDLPTPQEVLRDLFDGDPGPLSPGLTRSDWTVLTEALIDRDVTSPGGTTGTMTDGVLTLRRADRPG